MPALLALALPLLILALLVLALLVPPLPARAGPVRITAFGDSLTAGYGLPEPEGFTAQLQAALRARGIEAEVANAGVSGDTSTGALARLDWTLADKPDILIVEIGANDGLRGIDPALTRGNLDAILKTATEAGIRVLLAGMLAPPNLGRDYAQAFNTIYPDLAAKYHVALYPFFLDGVVLDPKLKLEDGMHPNARGVARIVAGILPAVADMMAKASGERG